MGSNEKSTIELRHIVKYYGDFRASDDVSLTIEGGRLVALLGPSGSGKTTILRMIAGLEHPDGGEILIDGQVVNDIPGSERGIGFVFQSYALFRYLTVYENIAFGLRLKKWPEKKIRERVFELLKLIGCEGLEKRYPGQLSGGQRQRVAFARALAPSPKILLLDEPFAAIDAKIRLELRSWLKEMITKLGITSIFVTHDQDEAIEVADDIVVTNHGRIEQVGTATELYTKPATPFVVQFIGHSTPIRNFTEFRSFFKGQENEIGILRPEYVEVKKITEVVRYSNSADIGYVRDIIFRGSNLEIKVDIHGNTISAIRSINEEPLEIGEKVWVFIYRMFVIDDRKVELRENASLREDSLVI
ncbi:MAG: sulfate ABC transporter ATP-binding protein [Lachnospiraceae bacterium]|nr:sulfate ABC transporter ATP-binding protein [Lachnospiraceae bacterium]